MKTNELLQEASQNGNALDLIKAVDYHNKTKRKELTTTKFATSTSHINLGKIRLNSKFNSLIDKFHTVSFSSNRNKRRARLSRCGNQSQLASSTTRQVCRNGARLCWATNRAIHWTIRQSPWRQATQCCCVTATTSYDAFYATHWPTKRYCTGENFFIFNSNWYHVFRHVATIKPFDNAINNRAKRHWPLPARKILAWINVNTIMCKYCHTSFFWNIYILMFDTNVAFRVIISMVDDEQSRNKVVTHSSAIFLDKK